MDRDLRLFWRNPTRTWRNPTRIRIGAQLFPMIAAMLLFLAYSGPGRAAQTPSNAPNSTAAEAAPVDSLRPALEEVGVALRQVQIERWKVSREWKEQFGSDASSIQQDLNGPLPGLFQAAQQSPTALAPQYAVMHNVDALYDVLVRLATAADLAGGKTDSAILGNALESLESARKAASTQLLQATSSQDQKMVKFQNQLKSAPPVVATANHNKTIVVDNRVTHKPKHRKPPTATTAAPPSSAKP